MVWTPLKFLIGWFFQDFWLYLLGRAQEEWGLILYEQVQFFLTKLPITVIFIWYALHIVKTHLIK